jgi:hypothetical protein
MENELTLSSQLPNIIGKKMIDLKPENIINVNESVIGQDISPSNNIPSIELDNSSLKQNNIYDRVPKQVRVNDVNSNIQQQQQLQMQQFQQMQNIKQNLPNNGTTSSNCFNICGKQIYKMNIYIAGFIVLSIIGYFAWKKYQSMEDAKAKHKKNKKNKKKKKEEQYLDEELQQYLPLQNERPLHHLNHHHINNQPQYHMQHQHHMQHSQNQPEQDPEIDPEQYHQKS